nr:unnamed protein product [Spirometra erinaceieuropaei]
MQEELTPAASALSQPTIARRINRYLELEDCAKCLTLLTDWDDQGCSIYKMSEHFTEPTGPLIKLLTKRRQGLHVSLRSPCGPTVEGGASLMLYKLLHATGLPNLVTLDLRKQCISIFDFLLLYRPRPSTEDESMLPCLQKIVVSLTKLEVSAEFCFGCSLDPTADSQIRSLEGAFTKVTELSIEPDRHMEFERFKTQPVSSEKLEPFLRMFPHLTTLRFCAGKWVRWSNLDVLLAACPRLEKLYVGTSTVEVETALQNATAHPVRTLVFDFPEAEVPCDFSGLKNCQETEYLLLRTNCKNEISQTDMMQCFSLLPRLRWLFCIMCRQKRTQVAHRASPGTTAPELRTLEYAEPSILATVYPQLDSLFWIDITTN